MAYEYLILERHDRVAHVQLNRPEVINALNYEMVDELYHCVEELGKDAGVGAIVLSGAGKGFCAGGDISLLETINGKTPSEIRTFLGEQFRKFSVLTRVEKPVIGALHGFVIGAGFGISLLCDIRIAAEKTTFGAEFVKMGIAPELGVSYLLPRLVGLGRAMELVFTARRFFAEEAERFGLVNRVVPGDSLVEEALKTAGEMAGLPPLAIGLAKAALQKAAMSDLMESYRVEAGSNAICYKTEDHKEAVQAFMEKRKPVYKGC